MSKLWGGGNVDFSSASADAQRGNNNTSSEKGITRNVLVHITGNRATWEHMGMHGALWRINPDRAGVIFGCNSSDGDNNNNNNGGGSGGEDGDSTS